VTHRLLKQSSKVHPVVERWSEIQVQRLVDRRLLELSSKVHPVVERWFAMLAQM
jgi:hypothetical protein